MDVSMELDDFSVRQTSALPLNIAAEAVGSFPDQFQESLHAREPIQPRSVPGGRELYTKEQWETQKHIIKQLYNLENKPYNRVIDILRTEHHFFPTRRQFYRKISEWGFEKNFKNKEMRDVLQRLNNTENQGEIFSVGLRGQKVDPVRIQRWRKRHGKVKNVARVFRDTSHDVASTQGTFNISGGDEQLKENDGLPNPTPKECTVDLLQSVDESQTRKFDHWSVVDIPGSPLLTKLFEALKIEWEDSIPCLDLASSSPAAALISPAKTDTTIEASEDINPEICVDFSLGAASNDLVNYSQEVFHDPDKLFTDPHSSSAALSFSEWSFREWDFAKGQPLKMGISHLYGISPYPVLARGGRYNCTACMGQSTYGTDLQLHDRENQIMLMLRKLKKTLGAEDLQTVLAIEKLGATYRAQGRLRQAERLFRHVTIFYHRIYGLKHRATLNAYKNVAQVLIDQRKVFQARKIYETVYDSVISLLGCDDVLALQFNRWRALFLLFEGWYEEAEKLVRQTFQIEMYTFGPEIDSITYHLRFLGSIFRRCGKEMESERLLRISLQILNKIEGRPISADFIYNVLDLTVVLRLQKRYEECRDLATTFVERLGDSAGQDTPEILSGISDIAFFAKAQGNLLDSEHHLRVILERMIRCVGECHPNIYETMVGLSIVLETMERFSEATILLEKSFEGFSKIYGLKATSTLRCCRLLAYNYADLGRWDDAVAVLQRSIDDAREPGKSLNLELFYTLHRLGQIFQMQSLYGEAITYYEECFKEFSNVRISYEYRRSIFLGLLICYGTLGRYNEMEDIFGKYKRILEAEERAEHSPDSQTSL